jgi:enoyl-CoA hydratase
VGTRLGMCGMEYFAHPWELARADEGTDADSDAIDAEDAWRHRHGVEDLPADTLAEKTLAFARRIANVLRWQR